MCVIQVSDSDLADELAKPHDEAQTSRDNHDHLVLSDDPEHVCWLDIPRRRLT
jgi:hypothetical protein